MLKNKKISLRKIIFATVPMAAVAVFFQNCTGNGFSTEMSSSSLAKGTLSSSSGGSNIGSNGIGSGSGSSSLQLLDGSIGNGIIVTRLVQNVKGANGPGLRGCTGPMASYYSGCLNDSEFEVVTSKDGWYYDASTDTYSINYDVSAQGFPQTEYFSRYILPNGQRGEFRFKPIVHKDSSIGNGSVITTLAETISGVKGSGLLGCTGLMSSYYTGCLRDSEFQVLTSVAGWSYDALNDVYSVNSNVTQMGFPQAQYFTRYILPNGLRTEVKFTPTAAARPVVKSCDWTHWAFGGQGLASVGSSCSTANVGATAVDSNGVTQTCICQ